MTYKNTFQQGVTREEREEYLPAEQGINVHGGIPKTSAEELSKQDQFRGMPMPGPGMVPDVADFPAHCAGTTKKGQPCKAYAVSNSVFCMVHNK
jgi:hypothetical protein